MLRIFRTLVALGAVVFMVCSGLVAASYDPEHYMLAGRDKYRRLNSITQSKIVLVGGSNVAFSVDSEKLETAFGMPVVNTALTIGLGLKYMLNEVAPALRPGDVVIVMPEYELYHALPLAGKSIDLGAAAKYCPECFLTSNVAEDPQQMALAVAGLFQGVEGDFMAKLRPTDEIYNRAGFNSRGDMVAHLGRARYQEVLNHLMPLDPRAIQPAVDFLNSFYRIQRDKNVRVFLSFPTIPEREYYAQKGKFSGLYKRLSAGLEIPILGAPEDFVYPIDLFYDTVYHLNAAGRDQRTQQLIELLAPALEK